MHLDNSVNVLVLKVRHGDVVTEKEAQTRIVIFKVKRFSHIRRHLVNKAKNALIFAAALLIHKIGFKIKAKIVVFGLLDRHRAVLAVKTDYFYFNAAVNHIEPVVQNVLYDVSVY